MLRGCLREMGATAAEISRAVERMAPRNPRPPFGKPTLTPRTKRVIELAVEEARQMGHPYIGTEHLLLGLVQEGEGIAAEVLRSLGVDSGSGAHPDQQGDPGEPGAGKSRQEEGKQDAAHRSTGL